MLDGRRFQVFEKKKTEGDGSNPLLLLDGQNYYFLTFQITNTMIRITGTPNPTASNSSGIPVVGVVSVGDGVGVGVGVGAGVVVVVVGVGVIGSSSTVILAEYKAALQHALTYEDLAFVVVVKIRIANLVKNLDPTKGLEIIESAAELVDGLGYLKRRTDLFVIMGLICEVRG